MDPAARVKVGNTSLHVTRMGYGAGVLGGMYQKVPGEQAQRAIGSALALGVRFFDVAPFYGHGASELRLRRGLAGQERDSLTVATKVGRVLLPAPRGYRDSFFHNAAPFVPVFDYSYDGVMRSFESSLKRLGLDRIDILHIHDPDAHYREALRFAYPALEKLRRSGAVGAIGVGMNQVKMLVRFAKEADFDCFLVAGRYTLIDHKALAQLLPLCVEKKISVFIGGVYNSGILATGPVPGAKFDYGEAPGHIVRRVTRVKRICDDFAVPLKAAAIQFPFGHPAVASVITGCRSAAEVEENARMMRFKIPPEMWVALREQKLIPIDAPVPANEMPDGVRMRKDQRKSGR